MADDGEARETLAEMQLRHEHELVALKEENDERLKKATKKTKRAVQAQVNQLVENMEWHHQQELDELNGNDEDDDSEDERNCAAEEAAAKLESLRIEEERKIAKKREKAQNKKLEKARKQREKEAQKDFDRENTVSMRDIEMEGVMRKLGPLHLGVKEIPSDGHCLYRAVADQMIGKGLQESLGDNIQTAHLYLRTVAADYISSHRQELLPFLELEVGPGLSENDAFVAYCARVRDSACWGGQPELTALSASLRVPIEVFSADAPTVVMGQEHAEGGDALQLTFHRHYYSLGEHYNSVESARN